MVEERLEDFAVWYAVCRPSGRQASHKSIGKYVEHLRVVPEVPQGGARTGRARVSDRGHPKGLRAVDQPPPLERIGCAQADLARGMEIALASEPDAVRCMWRAALTFDMLAMARAVEIALDAGRREVFDDTQHMTARDVAAVQRAGYGQASGTRQCGCASARTCRFYAGRITRCR